MNKTFIKRTADARMAAYLLNKIKEKRCQTKMRILPAEAYFVNLIKRLYQDRGLVLEKT